MSDDKSKAAETEKTDKPVKKAGAAEKEKTSKPVKKVEAVEKEQKIKAVEKDKTAKAGKPAESVETEKAAKPAKKVEAVEKEQKIKPVEAVEKNKTAKEGKSVEAGKAIEAAGTEKAAKPAKKSDAVKYTPRLKHLYQTEAIKSLMSLYKYSTPMAIPRLVKVIINIGVGEATQDKAVLDPSVEEITMIAGQRAVKTYAKKSISNFHLREGMPIGVKVNLRGSRMYDFLDKLISIALPRVRDFKGLNLASFDGRGNFTIGLKEQLVFPEIDYDKIKKIRGMDITIVTTAKNDEEALQLLKLLGFPFKEK